MSVYWYFIKPRDSENPSDHVCNILLLWTPAEHNILLMNNLNSKADTHFVGSYRFKQRNWPVFINTQMNETGQEQAFAVTIIWFHMRFQQYHILWETTTCSLLTVFLRSFICLSYVFWMNVLSDGPSELFIQASLWTHFKHVYTHMTFFILHGHSCHARAKQCHCLLTKHIAFQRMAAWEWLQKC